MDCENIDWMVAAVIYRFKLATLIELQTVYGLKDLYDMFEAGYVFEENTKRFAQERALSRG